MNSLSTTVGANAVVERDVVSRLGTGLGVRVRDYLSIAKPRIALMVLVTVAVGYFLASRGEFALLPLVHAAVGIVLAATASSALNQYIERDSDARMERTRRRPLPAGRLAPAEILTLGIVLSGFSTIYLASFVNVTTAVLTLLTVLVYAGVYTPLKRSTAFCTAIGAIPGAMPPVLGWTAAGAELDATAFALFAIVFLWQFPHFFAIAWLYKDQYSAAGLRMLPANGRGRITGWLALAYALCLIPAGLIPTAAGMAGTSAALMSVLLGLVYAGAALNFLWNESRASARNLLLVSLVYLPTVLLSVTLDHWRLLNL